MVQNGKLQVDDQEHWNKSTSLNGARGVTILKRVVYQLACIFNDLGVGRPEVKVNYGQRLLEISPATQDILREIRHKIYGAQK